LQKVFSSILVLVFSLTLSLHAQESTRSANVAGSWQISWQGHRGNEQGALHLQQEGDKLTGTLVGPRGSSELTGTVQGSNISFNVEMQGRRSFTLAFTGTVDGDKMSGTLQPKGGEAEEGHAGHRGGQGNHNWSATRQQGKSGRDNHNQNQDDDYADGL